MLCFKNILPVALFAVATIAAPLETRQSATTCGSTRYSYSQVNAAANAACNYVSSGGTAGGSTYPHQYNNYEGFDFPVSGPWYEFPIKSSGTYTGGSPGANRVIINGYCEYAGAITHTGASGNNFVGCSGTS
ncbi:hypothetical protein LTS18_010374 [Coniosporium uncinatum]|uniref:Uncharacterized protein n=1 Tax=Coniosporium uncinatum TaxID=93489 RepID=A0ACC3DA33_9PEZI|nr:hypothetical protein LTS18_010374 [Coniosporium uncinatum]